MASLKLGDVPEANHCTATKSFSTMLPPTNAAASVKAMGLSAPVVPTLTRSRGFVSSPSNTGTCTASTVMPAIFCGAAGMSATPSIRTPERAGLVHVKRNRFGLVFN